MKTWTETRACRSKSVDICTACRRDEGFRLGLYASGRVDERDFACPWGFTAERLPSEPVTAAPAQKARCCGKT